jgi:CMP-N-acetylneuraminic acid synthetase
MIKNKYKILAIIPARGGSKGVPGKNIKRLAGKPLIAWTIETAQNTSCLDRIIVSTDDEKIAAIAREYGAEVPFLRPQEFAGDTSSDMEVYLHALGWLADNENYYPDIIVWLRPTAPLRLSCDIGNGVDKLIASGADWVRSVSLVEHHPYWMFRLDDDRLRSFVDGVDISKYLRRQLLPPAYRVNGAVDVAWRKTLVEKNLLYCGDVRGCITPPERSVDIDTELDFVMAEAIIKKAKK